MKRLSDHISEDLRDEIVGKLPEYCPISRASSLGDSTARSISDTTALYSFNKSDVIRLGKNSWCSQINYSDDTADITIGDGSEMVISRSCVSSLNKSTINVGDNSIITRLQIGASGFRLISFADLNISIGNNVIIQQIFIYSDDSVRYTGKINIVIEDDVHIHDKLYISFSAGRDENHECSSDVDIVIGKGTKVYENLSILAHINRFSPHKEIIIGQDNVFRATTIDSMSTCPTIRIGNKNVLKRVSLDARGPVNIGNNNTFKCADTTLDISAEEKGSYIKVGDNNFIELSLTITHYSSSSRASKSKLPNAIIIGDGTKLLSTHTRGMTASSIIIEDNAVFVLDMGQYFNSSYTTPYGHLPTAYFHAALKIGESASFCSVLYDPCNSLSGAGHVFELIIPPNERVMI